MKIQTKLIFFIQIEFNFKGLLKKYFKKLTTPLVTSKIKFTSFEFKIKLNLKLDFNQRENNQFTQSTHHYFYLFLNDY